MDNLKHYSVLLNESINLLDIKDDGIYVDATLGGGGHSEAILKKLSNGFLYGIDQDSYAIAKANERLKEYHNFQTLKGNFKDLKELLSNVGVSEIDGIVYDLGVSSFQLDDESRGFSYRFDNALDMRMNQEQSLTAYDVVNTYSYSDLVKIFFEYGEERYAKEIAKKICYKREVQPIKTTFELVDIIKSALPAKELRKSGHPAKQVFQAIRIEVNDELNVLKESLKQASELLKPGGTIVVITFHSLEDRIVKTYFRELSTVNLPKGVPFVPDYLIPKFEEINHKVILPSEEELAENNRSHSAKLRGLKKKLTA